PIRLINVPLAKAQQRGFERVEHLIARILTSGAMFLCPNHGRILDPADALYELLQERSTKRQVADSRKVMLFGDERTQRRIKAAMKRLITLPQSKASAAWIPTHRRIAPMTSFVTPKLLCRLWL